MDKFIIRPAQLGEEQAIHEAHMRSIREICIKDHGEDEVRGWGNRPLGNRWTDAIKSGHVWVVESAGNIYGHAYIRIFEKDGEKRGHVHGLYLTPEALGQGIGRKLGDLMLKTAEQEGAQAVTLESTLTAHEFYKRLGFKDTSGVQTLEIGGYPVRYFPMELHLK